MAIELETRRSKKTNISLLRHSNEHLEQKEAAQLKKINIVQINKIPFHSIHFLKI